MRLQTGISPNYVKGWDISKAIREVLQNYLDSRQEFNCDGSVTYDKEKGQANVKDNGPGLELRHLALGISEKSVEAKGKYGEGLKLALLVFAREKRPIEIWAQGKIIRPEISYCPEFRTDLLFLIVEDMPPHWAARHKGTSIKFDCSEEELEEGKGYFLEFIRYNDADFKWIVPNKLSLPCNRIFVNGTIVGHIPGALFSYHFNESEVGDIGNRDREVVDHEKVLSAASRLWVNLTNKAAVKALIRGILEGDCWELSVTIYSWDVDRHLWKRAFLDLVGDKAVLTAGNTKIDNSAQYLGYKIVGIGLPYRWLNLFGRIGIPTAEEVVTAAAQKERPLALADLSKEERLNFILAKKLVSEHYADPGEVAVYGNLSTGAVNAVGLCENGKISISRRILESLTTALQTILHETVHKVSGTGDLTEEFEREWTKICARLILKLNQNENKEC